MGKIVISLEQDEDEWDLDIQSRIIEEVEEEIELRKENDRGSPEEEFEGETEVEEDGTEEEETKQETGVERIEGMGEPVEGEPEENERHY